MKLPALAAATILIALAAAQPSPAQPPATPAAPVPCDPGVAAKFVCGVRNPEDLVLIPGTDWIVGSQWAMNAAQAPGGLFLIDRKAHTAAKLSPPAGTARKPFDKCPGPPAFATLSTHGLHVRAAGRGKAILYVVGHGGREAIEVFDIAIPRTGAPTLTWAGCIMAPTGATMNAVAPLADGRLIATDFYDAPFTLADGQAGKITGAVYIWKAGGAFTKMPGTELAAANGLEITPDGKYMFVAEWGKSTIKRFEVAAPEKPAWSMPLAFRVDNVRWAPDGRLLMAGPGAAPDCAPGTRCAMIPMVGALDPRTLTLTMLKQGPAERTMGAISTALIVGDELWTGSYGGDRVAYQAAPK